MPILRRNEKGEFEEVRYSNPTPEMLILSKLDELKEELDIVSSKLLITEAIPKEQYENRLKDDMIAMLEQLDSEIQEQIAFMGDGEETNGMKRADNLVRDKINALKQSIWQDNCNVKEELEDEDIN